MRKVFVDTLHLAARASPHDHWCEAARSAEAALGPGVRLFVTHEVLTEFLSAMASAGPYYRTGAGHWVERILADPTMTVVPASAALFARGLRRYLDRPDKEYSLVDRISMEVCESEGIREVLTNDHHFEQEGLIVLIRRA